MNDSGQPLELELDLDRVIVLETNRRKLSVARNAGAAIARGRYLHFLDDDDWMKPGWLKAFTDLATESPEASLIYGGCSVVDQDGTVLGEINLGITGNCAAQMLSNSWIQVGTAAIRAEYFFQMDGFSTSILPCEDTDLFRRLSLRSDFANTSFVVLALLRGEGWKTSTDFTVTMENSRISREEMLNSPNAWSRVNASASSPYWRGKNLKSYMASTLWNYKHRRFAILMSRLSFSTLSLMVTVPSLFTREFWTALRNDHVPASLAGALLQNR